MARSMSKVFVILMATVLVNALTPLEKLDMLKARGAVAVGQVKHAINTYKLNTQAKLYNMKSYLNYLKNWVYAKAFPYTAKPLLKQAYTGYDYKFPGYYYYGQPYSYVQYYGPGVYKSAGLL